MLRHSTDTEDMDIDEDYLGAELAHFARTPVTQTKLRMEGQDDDKGQVELWHGVEDGTATLSERMLTDGLRLCAPHRLDSVRKDDFLVRVTLLVVVAAVVDEFHLLQDRRLYAGVVSNFLARRRQWQHTFPDSPAPRSNILISFLAVMRSFLSWFSISSLPTPKTGHSFCISVGFARGLRTGFCLGILGI